MCRCLAQVDRLLATKNTRLVVTLAFKNGDASKTVLRTEQIETGRGKGKAVAVIPTPTRAWPCRPESPWTTRSGRAMANLTHCAPAPPLLIDNGRASRSLKRGDAITAEMNAEVVRYEQRLSEKSGREVKLAPHVASATLDKSS